MLPANPFALKKLPKQVLSTGGGLNTIHLAPPDRGAERNRKEEEALPPRSRGRDGLRGPRFNLLRGTGTKQKTKQATAGHISTAKQPRMPGSTSVCGKTGLLFQVSPKASLTWVVLERGGREDGMEGCGLRRH